MLFFSDATGLEICFFSPLALTLQKRIGVMIKYQIPTWLQKCYTGVTWRKNADQKVLYITFDDGCVPEVTPQVLKILKEKQVKATFFCVGDNVRKYPQLFEFIKSEGHQVGNHTHNHLKGTQTPLNKYWDNIQEANQLIGSHLFRPPYGKMTWRQKRYIRKYYEIVLWDVLTNDFDATVTVEELILHTTHHTRNGSIIVFHDSIKAAERMLKALPILIETWKEQGYTFESL